VVRSDATAVWKNVCLWRVKEHGTQEMWCANGIAALQHCIFLLARSNSDPVFHLHLTYTPFVFLVFSNGVFFFFFSSSVVLYRIVSPNTRSLGERIRYQGLAGKYCRGLWSIPVFDRMRQGTTVSRSRGLDSADWH
jgi:hypothetical protein